MRSTALGDIYLLRLIAHHLYHNRSKEKILLSLWVLINCSEMQNWWSRGERKCRRRGRECRRKQQGALTLFHKRIGGRKQKKRFKKWARKRIKMREKIYFQICIEVSKNMFHGTVKHRAVVVWTPTVHLHQLRCRAMWWQMKDCINFQHCSCLKLYPKLKM